MKYQLYLRATGENPDVIIRNVLVNGSSIVAELDGRARNEALKFVEHRTEKNEHGHLIVTLIRTGETGIEEQTLIFREEKDGFGLRID